MSFLTHSPEKICEHKFSQIMDALVYRTFHLNHTENSDKKQLEKNKTINFSFRTQSNSNFNCLCIHFLSNILQHIWSPPL